MKWKGVEFWVKVIFLSDENLKWVKMISDALKRDEIIKEKDNEKGMILWYEINLPWDIV